MCVCVDSITHTRFEARCSNLVFLVYIIRGCDLKLFIDSFKGREAESILPSLEIEPGLNLAERRANHFVTGIKLFNLQFNFFLPFITLKIVRRNIEPRKSSPLSKEKNLRDVSFIALNF